MHVEQPGGNCIKISLPGKSILGDYFQENRTSRRHFLLLRISFPGRPIFIQFVPESLSSDHFDPLAALEHVAVLGPTDGGVGVAVDLKVHRVNISDLFAPFMANISNKMFFCNLLSAGAATAG